MGFTTYWILRFLFCKKLEIYPNFQIPLYIIILNFLHSKKKKKKKKTGKKNYNLLITIIVIKLQHEVRLKCDK